MLTQGENPNILEFLLDADERRRQGCLKVLEVFNLRIMVERYGKHEGLTVEPK